MDLGIDAKKIIEEVRAEDSVAGCILESMWAFGLRFNESVSDESTPAATRHHTFSCLAEVSADVEMLMALFRACGPARCSCRTLPALAKGIPVEMHFPDGATVETVASRIRMV